MKKAGLFLIAVFLFGGFFYVADAQAGQWEDDFDDYATGTWAGNGAWGESGLNDKWILDTYSSSTPNSGYMPNGCGDMVYLTDPFAPTTEGVISFWGRNNDTDGANHKWYLYADASNTLAGTPICGFNAELDLPDDTDWHFFEIYWDTGVYYTCEDHSCGATSTYDYTTDCESDYAIKYMTAMCKFTGGESSAHGGWIDNFNWTTLSFSGAGTANATDDEYANEPFIYPEYFEDCSYTIVPPASWDGTLTGMIVVPEANINTWKKFKIAFYDTEDIDSEKVYWYEKDLGDMEGYDFTDYEIGYSVASSSYEVWYYLYGISGINGEQVVYTHECWSYFGTSTEWSTSTQEKLGWISGWFNKIWDTKYRVPFTYFLSFQEWIEDLSVDSSTTYDVDLTINSTTKGVNEWIKLITTLPIFFVFVIFITKWIRWIFE